MTPAPSHSGQRPALAGDIAKISLFDILQMLVLSGRTGVFTVARQGARGDFYFERGDIVGVVDDRGNEGMLAAVGLLLIDEGQFQFFDVEVQVARSVAEKGDAFLLEAARQVDEFRESRPDAEEGFHKGDLSEEAALVLRRRAMENLRDLFSSVTAQSSEPQRRGLDLEVLEAEPGTLGVDAVYLRPGQAPVARRARRMVQLWPEPLTTDALLEWLYEVAPSNVEGLIRSQKDGTRFTLRAADGCWLDVSVFYECSQPACVVRVVSELVQEPEAIGLNQGLIEPLLRRGAGLLVLAGPAGTWRSRAFSALVAMAVKQRGGLVVALEKQRVVRMDDPARDYGSVALFQRNASTPTEVHRALAFAREQEADIVAASPLPAEALQELAVASWPLLLVGAVTAQGAIEGMEVTRRLVERAVPEGADQWLADHLMGVIATGNLRVEGGARPASEVLAVGPATHELIANGRIGELKLAFLSGRLKGSMSLAQLAHRYDGEAA